MSLLVAKVKAEWDERVARYAADKAAREKEGLPEEDSGEEDDYYAVEAREFRNTWNFHYSRYSGCFEDTSELFNYSNCIGTAMTLLVASILSNLASFISPFPLVQDNVAILLEYLFILDSVLGV